MSAHQLSTQQETALERGFNFATVPAKLQKEDIIGGVEVALRRQKKQPQERQERARAAVANILRTAKPPPTNLTKEERKGMKKLRDKPVTILCADKGNTTVVLDTSTYEKKPNDIPKKPPFKKLLKDPTTQNERKVNSCMKELAKKDKNTADTLKRLQVSVHGTKPAMFYGSVKIHKEGYPLRPIVSTVGTATYPTAKYLSRILTQRKYAIIYQKHCRLCGKAEERDNRRRRNNGEFRY